VVIVDEYEKPVHQARGVVSGQGARGVVSGHRVALKKSEANSYSTP
jgi:hypothetical protein